MACRPAARVPSTNTAPRIASTRRLRVSTRKQSTGASHGEHDCACRTHRASGGVRIDGAERLAAYWLQLLKRPSAAARMALGRARRRAPAALATVPALQAGGCDEKALHAALADTLDASVPLVLRGMVNWPEVAWTLDDWRTQEGATVLRADPSSGLPQTVADFIDGFAAQSLADSGAATYTEGCLLP